MSSLTVVRQPSNVRVYTDTARHTIRSRNNRNIWQAENIGVSTQVHKDRLLVSLGSPTSAVTYIELRWQQRVPRASATLAIIGNAVTATSRGCR